MMKKITLLLALVFAVNLTAQTQYEKGMNKAFQLWGQQKNTEASQLFERIANAEKDKWLPSYYAGLIEVLGSFANKKTGLWGPVRNLINLFFCFDCFWLLHVALY